MSRYFRLCSETKEDDSARPIMSVGGVVRGDALLAVGRERRLSQNFGRSYSRQSKVLSLNNLFLNFVKYEFLCNFFFIICPKHTKSKFLNKLN